MSANTKIEWADHTFNPWEGCQKVGPGCDNCYAENRNARFGGGVAINWGPGAPRRRTSEKNWGFPPKWNAEAERQGICYRVFCASLADWLDNAVPIEWLVDLLDLVRQTPGLDWLLLTKRIGNLRPRLDMAAAWITRAIAEAAGTAVVALNESLDWIRRWLDGKPPCNVLIGATIANQEEADRDISKLLAVPAAKRFLSMEPLLASVKLPRFCACGCRKPWPLAVSEAMNGPSALNREQAEASVDSTLGIDWVIVGGESGPKARPMHPQWVRSLRDQCNAAGVPFLFKQHGEWLATEFCDDDLAMIPSKRTVYVHPDGSFHDGANGVDVFGGEEETAWVGKKAAGRMLDGRMWDEVPQ